MTLEQLPPEFPPRPLSSGLGIRQSTPNSLYRPPAIGQGAQGLYEKRVGGLVFASRHFVGDQFAKSGREHQAGHFSFSK
jgi:hypothetical protein